MPNGVEFKVLEYSRIKRVLLETIVSGGER